ncbi:MAG: polysulfide reductase NrfD [Actinobacteria bacterium]|nr:polysulfide reductase NrfD [Actinomycetota bacterium]
MSAAEIGDAVAEVEDVTLAPLARSSSRFRWLVAFLLIVIGFGLYAYSVQLHRGLAVTGMAPTINKVMWGLYITNFVFFIGISHAGTLISAILRVSHAGWRTPITRMAEFITVVALSVGALFPIFDLGRPDRMLNVLRFGRWPSPIMWDFFAIATYFVGSVTYLYLPMIPDLAICRDRLAGVVSRRREHFYRVFSAGWRNTPEQRRSLASAIGLMMIVIIPVAVSVHTVVSWIFAMTLRTGWNTAIFGIYFVGGAIFSGIATLIVVMAVLRRIYHLERFITERHFVNLGYLLVSLALVMLYFNISEFLTAGYKLEGNEPVYLGQIFTGSFAPLYWFYVVAGLLVPILLITIRRTRRLHWVVAAAALVDVAMWMERYVIVVASLKVPQMPYANPARYFPSWVELAISLGALAFFALLITLFTRFLPVMAMWEIREHEAEPEVSRIALEPARQVVTP